MPRSTKNVFVKAPKTPDSISLDGFEVICRQSKGNTDQDTRNDGNDCRCPSSPFNKRTKEIATNRIDNSVANNTHNSHEATQISSNFRT